MLPLVTSFQGIGNAVDIVGGYTTGGKCMDVLAGGGAASIWTLTFDDDGGSGAFDVGDTVVCTVYDDLYPQNVVTVTYTIVTGLTDEDGVAAAYADEWNVTLGASSWMSASDPDLSGADAIVTLTGRAYGQAFTVTVTDQGGASVVAAESQSAADPEDVEPGRCMVQHLSSGVAQFDRSSNTRIGRRFKKSNFTAMYKTWAVTGLTEAASAICTEVTFQGVTMQTVRTVMDTDNNTTITAHVAALETALNAKYGAGTGLVATVPVAGSVKIAVDVAGSVFEARTWIDGPEANAAITLTETGSPNDPTYSLPAAFLGVSSWQPHTQPTSYTSSQAVYKGGQCVPVWVGGGSIAVDCDDAPNPSDMVYVNGGTSAPGTFTDTAGTDNVALCWPDGRKLLVWTGQSTSTTARLAKGY